MATESRDNTSSVSRKYAMTAAPFLIAMAAAYNWVIAPHVGYLHAMQRLEPVMDEMAHEGSLIDRVRDKKIARLEGLRTALAAARAELFTCEEAKAFIQNLQTVVERSGCTMAKADFIGGKKADKAAEPNLPIRVEPSGVDVTVVGEYGRVIMLLGLLRGQRQRIQVDSCRMDLLDPRSGRLECRLGLTIHIALQPGELGS